MAKGEAPRGEDGVVKAPLLDATAQNGTTPSTLSVCNMQFRWRHQFDGSGNVALGRNVRGTSAS